MKVDVIHREDAATILQRNMPPSNECVYMCIGTENILSDSLGPRVGSLLQQNMAKPMFVYGLCQSNINALNLLGAYSLIKVIHPDKKIVVIDAAVGSAEEVGTVQVLEGSLVPGAATNKNLPYVGDFSILGIVSMRGVKDFYVTNHDRQALVEKMAQVIATAISVV